MWGAAAMSAFSAGPWCCAAVLMILVTSHVAIAFVTTETSSLAFFRSSSIISIRPIASATGDRETEEWSERNNINRLLPITAAASWIPSLLSSSSGNSNSPVTSLTSDKGHENEPFTVGNLENEEYYRQDDYRQYQEDGSMDDFSYSVMANEENDLNVDDTTASVKAISKQHVLTQDKGWEQYSNNNNNDDERQSDRGIYQLEQQQIQPVSAKTNNAATTLSTPKKDDNSNHDENQDNLDKFAQDVRTVLKELRADLHDPTLPSYFRHAEHKRPSACMWWTHGDWARYSSRRRRYWEWSTNFFTSRLLRRVFPQLAFLIAWSALAVLSIHHHHHHHHHPPTQPPSSSLYSLQQPAAIFLLLHGVKIDLTPLSLVSTLVGFLLTLRSNQGLSRLGDGRLAFGQVVLHTRDMAHVIATEIYPKQPQLGLLLARHVALFGWLLKLNLRGEEINGTDEDIIKCMLPNPRDADFILRARKKPVAVVQRLRQVFSYMSSQLPVAVQQGLDQKTRSLNHCIMTCERILASPIPPLYTAHAGRLLIFYLLCLPFGLRDLLGKLGTLVTTAVVGYAMLGLDEVSHLLEQPFRLMPLYQLSKNSMLDVADAFCVQPPPLLVVDNDSHHHPNGERVVSPPPLDRPDPCYWPSKW